MPALAVRVTLPPGQRLVPDALMLGTAYVTLTGAESPEQLLTVAWTQYEPACVTTIERVVAPLDQR